MCGKRYHAADREVVGCTSGTDVFMLGTDTRNMCSSSMFSNGRVGSLLDARDGMNTAKRCSFDIVHSVLVSFLDGEYPYNLEALRHLETFLAFSTTSLLIGRVYMGKYLSKTSVKRGDCYHFIKLYLACCLVATKYIDDTRIFNDLIVSRWGFCAGEINRFEMDILVSLDFDLHVPDEKVRRVLERKIRLIGTRRATEVMYSCVIEGT